MTDQKQYGRLSVTELNGLVENVRRARCIHPEMKRLAAPLLEAHGAYWFAYYDLPFAHHLALVSLALGIGPQLSECAAAANPTREFLQFLEGAMELEDNRLGSLEPEALAAFLNLITSLSHSIQAIGYFSLSINELLARATEGNRAALLRAVSIDPTVLASRTGSQLFAMAQIRDDKPFLRSLRKAIKGPHIGRRRHLDIRTMHRILEETDALRSCTANELLDLVGDELQMYSTRSSDPVKGLRSLFSAWKDESTR